MQLLRWIEKTAHRSIPKAALPVLQADAEHLLDVLSLMFHEENMQSLFFHSPLHTTQQTADLGPPYLTACDRAEALHGPLRDLSRCMNNRPGEHIRTILHRALRMVFTSEREVRDYDDCAMERPYNGVRHISDPHMLQQIVPVAARVTKTPLCKEIKFL